MDNVRSLECLRAAHQVNSVVSSLCICHLLEVECNRLTEAFFIGNLHLFMITRVNFSLLQFFFSGWRRSLIIIVAVGQHALNIYFECFDTFLKGSILTPLILYLFLGHKVHLTVTVTISENLMMLLCSLQINIERMHVIHRESLTIISYLVRCDGCSILSSFGRAHRLKCLNCRLDALHLRVVDIDFSHKAAPWLLRIEMLDIL